MPASADPPAAPAAPPAPPRRRRAPRRLLAALLVLLALLVAADLGAGWYFAGQVVSVSRAPWYPVRVVATAAGEVTLSRDADTERPGIYGLDWRDGRAVLGAVRRVTNGTVVREVRAVLDGELRAGVDARVDHYVHAGDPGAVRVPFTEVRIPSELGDLPAWQVPGTGRTWVVAVHGRGGSRAEALRALPTLHAAGVPALVVTYRNDEGAPASPDGRYHLGDTEWRDVAAAVRYARGQGAADVVLYGWSMGGALVMTALRRMPEADAVRGVVLDCPVLDWGATLDLQAAQRSLPAPLTATAKVLVEQRIDVELDDFDQRRYAPKLAVPVLLYVDGRDPVVAAAPSVAFAGARPDLVTLVRTDAGGHTTGWNVDPEGYERRLAEFLARLHP